MSDATVTRPERVVAPEQTAAAVGHVTLAQHGKAKQEAGSAAPNAQTMSFWTVERALYALFVLVGTYWRGWALGVQPLSAWEAANSWPAWLTAHGFSTAGASTPNSPLYYGLQWLLFWLGLDGEWGARLVALGAGVALIVVAWWWRAWLGRPAALVLAALLAFDPWATALSRMADGASLSLLLGFVALTALVNVVADPLKPGARNWMRVAAVATGLLVVSGPLGLNLLPVVALGVWLWRDDLAEAGLLSQRLWVWLAGAVLLGGSLLLVRLDGLAWLAPSVSRWLGQFGGDTTGLRRVTGTYDLEWLAARVALETMLPLVLGLIGLAVTWAAAQQGNPIAVRWSWLMGGWLLWGLLLCLLPGRGPYSLGVLILPLGLLAAPVVVWLWGMRPHDVPRQELGAVVLTLLILLVSAAFWAAALGANPVFDAVIAQATGVILALALAILLAFGVWSRRQNAGWVAAALFVGLMGLAYLRAGWQAGHASLMTPSGWTARMAHPEVDQLVKDVEALSAQIEGDPFQLPVYVEMASYTGFNEEVVPAHRDPILGWALRQMDSVTWGDLPAADQVVGVVITVPQTDESPTPPLPAHYTGSEYDIEYQWSPSALAGDASSPERDGQAAWWRTRVRPWWRWAIYRQPTSPPPTRAVILWAPRSGLQISE